MRVEWGGVGWVGMGMGKGVDRVLPPGLPHCRVLLRGWALEKFFCRGRGSLKPLFPTPPPTKRGSRD